LNSQQLVLSERYGRYVSAGDADSAMHFSRQLSLRDVGGLAESWLLTPLTAK
jgi:hypothetical protein